MTGKLLDMFHRGDYTSCVQEAEQALATATDSSLRSEVLELLFHAYVELDLYDRAHDVAYRLFSAEPSNEKVVNIATLSALLNHDAYLLRQIAPQVENKALQETIVCATKSIVEYIFPMPYTLGLCWWRSLQGQLAPCWMAVSAIRDKDYAKGLQIAETVLKNTPNSFPFYWIVLVCSVSLGRYDVFNQLCERGIGLHPDYWRLYLYKGIVSCSQGDYTQAQELFREAQHRNPQAGETWLRYGACLYEQARYDDAVRAYKAALRIFRDLGTPVRYGAMIETVAQLIPAQTRRLRLPRSLFVLWYRLLWIPLILRYVKNVKSIVDTVEHNFGVRYEIECPRTKRWF